MPSRGQVYVPWSEGLQPSWTIAGARAALTDHELGQFAASARLTTAMGRDDRLTAVLGVRISGLLGLPRTMVPGDDDDAAKALAEEVDEKFDTWAPNDALAEMLGWYHMAGLAIAQVIWEVRDKEWIPRLEVWDLQWFWWDPELRIFWVITRQGTIPLDLSSGQWLMLSKGGRPWLNGAIRSLTAPWLGRQFAWRDWNRFNERHGLPIILLKYPFAADGEEKDEFFDDAKVLSSNTTLGLPQNVTGADTPGASFDAELLEAKDQAFATFGELLVAANIAIAVRLLGQNLTTEVGGGSFAAAKTHDRVRLDLTQGDERELSQFAGKLIGLYIRFNGRSAAQPTASWETDPPEDVNLTAQAIKTLGEAIGELAKNGLELTDESEAELFNRTGVELQDIVPTEDQPPEIERPVGTAPAALEPRLK